MVNLSSLARAFWTSSHTLQAYSTAEMAILRSFANGTFCLGAALGGAATWSSLPVNENAFFVRKWITKMRGKGINLHTLANVKGLDGFVLGGFHWGR